jgi:cytochrome c553
MKVGVSIPLLAVLTGCSGDFISSSNTPDGGDPARAMFEEQVLPMLVGSCVACHATADAKGFMVPNPDVYSTIITHPNLITPGDANDSRLYSYGRSSTHSGTELTLDEAELVRAWIELIPPTDAPPPQVETNKFAPLIGQTNSIDLAPLGEGLTGSSLSFDATQLAQGIYITNLQVQAGASGLHVVHPLFVTYCPAQRPDPVDSFYGMDLVVNPNDQGMIGGGTVILVDFAPGCMLSVHFKTIEPGMTTPGGDDGGGGPTGGGCVNVAGFSASARAPLANQCASCHAGGNTTAKNAWDISAINDLSATGQAAACAQTRNKLNLTNEANSIIFQRVAPGQQTGHPLTINDPGQFAAFRDPVVGWAVTE